MVDALLLLLVGGGGCHSRCGGWCGCCCQGGVGYHLTRDVWEAVEGGRVVCWLLFDV